MRYVICLNLATAHETFNTVYSTLLYNLHGSEPQLHSFKNL